MQISHIIADIDYTNMVHNETIYQYIFGLVYNLIRLHGASVARSTVFSMVAPVLMVGVSNLVGILEFIRIRGWGSVAAWEWLGIKDVDLGGVWGFLGPAEHLSWRPQDYMWWWRSSRVIDSFDSSGASLDYTITEFPFFSFLLGDLHPHLHSHRPKYARNRHRPW